MMYNKNVQDCFFHPSHVGVLDLITPLSAHYRSSLAGQGVLIDLYIQCTKDKNVNRACFKANGNPYVIAALEWVCRQIEGENLERLPPINYQILVEKLEIPNTQYPFAIQIEEVYKKVLGLLIEKFERYEL